MALPLEVAGSIFSRDELSRGQKIPLVVLAARHVPCEHGPGFGIRLPLNEMPVGPFFPSDPVFFALDTLGRMKPNELGLHLAGETRESNLL